MRIALSEELHFAFFRGPLGALADLADFTFSMMRMEVRR